MGWREKKDKEKRVEAIMPGLVRDKGWETQLDLHSIFPNWQDVVEPDAANHATPLKIVKGTLWLEVENSAWLQQFQFRKVMLLKSINAYLKKSNIKNIRFTLPRENEGESKPEKKVRFVPPPQEEIQSFEEQVGFIEDKAARDSLIRLWYLSRACVRDDDSGNEKS